MRKKAYMIKQFFVNSETRIKNVEKYMTLYKESNDEAIKKSSCKKKCRILR